MKFLMFVILGLILYFILDTIIVKTQYRRFRRWLAPAIFVFMLTLSIIGAVSAALAPDMQCKKTYKEGYLKVVDSTNPKEYIQLGDYYYDLGNCEEAIKNYSSAIVLDKNYAEAYNNRGYTYMRLRVFNKALNDLNRAIEINPHYVNALMNRGDIYNYYFEIDHQKAILDYDTVLSIVKDNAQRRNLAVCEDKLIAKSEGWSPIVYLQILKMEVLKTDCE